MKRITKILNNLVLMTAVLAFIPLFAFSGTSSAQVPPTPGATKITCTNTETEKTKKISVSSGNDNQYADQCNQLGEGWTYIIPDPAVTTNCNKSGAAQCNVLSNIVNPVIATLTILVGLAVTVGIIIGGIQVSTSAGDPQKNAAGRKHIQNALIALVAYVMLYAFLNWLIPGGVL